MELAKSQSAYAHVMGRAAYEGMAGALPTAGGEGTRLFDDSRSPTGSTWFSSTEFSNGTVGLHYRRHR